MLRWLPGVHAEFDALHGGAFHSEGWYMLALAFGTQWSAQAQQKKDMPRTVVWTAYDVGSAGYIQAASIGHAMAQKAGITDLDRVRQPLHGTVSPDGSRIAYVLGDSLYAVPIRRLWELT